MNDDTEHDDLDSDKHPADRFGCNDLSPEDRPLLLVILLLAAFVVATLILTSCTMDLVPTASTQPHSYLALP